MFFSLQSRFTLHFAFQHFIGIIVSLCPINFELFVYIALFPCWCNPAPPLLVCVCPPCPPWWARVFSLSSRVPLSCLRVGSYSLAPGYANENGSELFVLTRQEVVIEHNYLLSHLFILSYYSWLMNIIYIFVTFLVLSLLSMYAFWNKHYYYYYYYYSKATCALCTFVPCIASHMCSV